MKLWLALIGDPIASLGAVVEANTEAQAFYKFMQDAIYPYTVVELPESVTLRPTLQRKEDDTNADGYYFSDRD